MSEIDSTELRSAWTQRSGDDSPVLVVAKDMALRLLGEMAGEVVQVGDHRLIVEGLLADFASGCRRVLLSDGSRHECAPDELWEVCRGAA